MMTDDEQSNPPSENPSPSEVSPPPIEGESGGEQQSAESVPPSPQPTAAPKPQTDWRDREIARLREQRREKDRQIEELKASSRPLDPTEDFNRRVQEAAAQQAQVLAAQQVFNQQCNAEAEKGRQAYPDFDARLTVLKNSVDFSDKEAAGRYNQFLVTALETGEGAKIIHTLGGDQSEAGRVLSLPPAKMAFELAKIVFAEGQPARRTEVSNAPQPITPIGRATTNRNPIDPTDPERADQLSTAEWMRRREEEVHRRLNGRG